MEREEPLVLEELLARIQELEEPFDPEELMVVLLECWAQLVDWNP